MTDQEFQNKVDDLESSDPEVFESYQVYIRDYGLEKAKQFYVDTEVNEMDFFEALDRIQGETELEKYGDGDEDETELSVEPEDDTPTEPAPIEPAPTDSEKSADIFSLIDEELNK